MSGKGKRLNSLDISAKAKIIGEVETGKKSKKDIAAEYGIPASTLSTILKNKETILAFFKAGNTSRKRARESDYPDVEEACLKWYKQYSEDPLNLIMGTRIREVAEQCAKSLGHNEFKASNGWLDKFKKRHNIILQRKASCESILGSTEVYDSWENKIAALTVGYDPENIFAAEETGTIYIIFYYTYYKYLKKKKKILFNACVDVLSLKKFIFQVYFTSVYPIKLRN